MARLKRLNLHVGHSASAKPPATTYDTRPLSTADDAGLRREQTRRNLREVLEVGGVVLWQWPQIGTTTVGFGEEHPGEHFMDIGDRFGAWRQHIHGDDFGRFAEALSASTQQPDSFEVEVRFRETPGAPFRWHSCKGVSALRDNGELGASGTFVDTHETVMVKERAAATLDRLSRVIEGVNLGVFEWELGTGTAPFVSDMCYDMLGYRREDVGLTAAFVRTILHPDDASHVEAEMRRFVRDRAPHAIDIRLRRGDGAYHWYEFHAIASEARDEPLRLTGSLRDIDGRKAEAVASATISERLALVVAGMGGGVWDWPDVTQDFIRLHDDYARLLGYGHAEMRNSVAFMVSLIHAEDVPAVWAALDRSCRTGESFSCKFRILFRERGYRWVNSVAAVTLDHGGPGKHRLTGFIVDIHEQLQAERRLEESNQHLGEFGYLVAHDLSAPLRHIQAFAEVLLEDHGASLHPEARGYVRTIGTSSRQASEIILALLEYARTGTNELHLTTVDLAAVVATVREILTVGGAHAGVRWEVGDLPTVQADATLMRMLFQNLLSNAVKFTSQEASPLIRITSEPEAGVNRCAIVVSDNGVGFEPNYAERIFRAFERAHSDEVYEGMGIGLANAARAVARHDGKLTATGEAGVGASFRVVLPLVQK